MWGRRADRRRAAGSAVSAGRRTDREVDEDGRPNVQSEKMTAFEICVHLPRTQTTKSAGPGTQRSGPTSSYVSVCTLPS